MPLCFEHFTFESAKNASALNDIERKRQCLLCFFLCFRLLAFTGDILLSQSLFLVATVRLSPEKLRFDDIEESSFNKEFSEQIFTDKHCVWC